MIGLDKVNPHNGAEGREQRMAGKIAIVGAGPSGCYVAQALLKARPELEVDVIEALPVPYGLIRYGVATDHQATKSITRQFARLFNRQGARFIGNLHIGRDVTLADLRKAYDAVVLATGLATDLRLGIPGDDLFGITGASALTRALYEHPDALPLPDLGREPVIIGTGNVAIDLLRLLSKSPAELDGSDLGPVPTAWLESCDFRRITVIGRSPAAKAKCDPAMIRELAKLSKVRFRIDNLNEDTEDDHGVARLEALHALESVAPAQAPSIEIVMRFGATPLAIEANGKNLLLHVGENAALSRETIHATSIITAIGFGRADDAIAGSDIDLTHVYSAGWCRYGPIGTIAKSRQNAMLLSEQILSELFVDPTKSGAAIFVTMAGLVNFSGWERIDAIETSRAGPNRCRVKCSTYTDLKAAAKVSAPQIQEITL
jgi:ferredoxin--NADP+ reductase